LYDPRKWTKLELKRPFSHFHTVRHDTRPCVGGFFRKKEEEEYSLVLSCHLPHCENKRDCRQLRKDIEKDLKLWRDTIQGSNPRLKQKFQAGTAKYTKTFNSRDDPKY
jgi:hypothetical protein